MAAPAIDPNYLDTEEDRRVHLEGMRIARRIMASTPIANLLIRKTAPGVNIDRDDELLDETAGDGATLYHPVSTCRMGPDPNRMWSMTGSGFTGSTAAGGRCLDHADTCPGGHQRPDHHDRCARRRR